MFVSERPLMLEQLKAVLQGYDVKEIREMILALGQEYEQTNRGLRIMEVAGGFRMITPPDLASFLKKLYKERKVERLSRPALETLAIIAYKQPVTRLEIESIRSVKNVDSMIKTLEEKEFIKVVGEKKAPGRPKVYGTTRQFLEYFGLNSLENLPKVEDISKLAPGELEARLQERQEVMMTDQEASAPVPAGEQQVEPEQAEVSNGPEETAHTN